MHERYNFDLCTFSARDLGLSLHEMYAIIGMSWGNITYEEHYLPFTELDELKRKNLEMYETYCELLCQFHICLDSHKESN